MRSENQYFKSGSSKEKLITPPMSENGFGQDPCLTEGLTWKGADQLDDEDRTVNIVIMWIWS